MNIRRELQSVSGLEASFLLLWFAGPFLYLIERSPADIWLTVMDIGFLVHCSRNKNWGWLKWSWVRAVAAFWVLMLGVSVISSNPGYALGEAMVWIRFPLYAAACAVWLGTRAERLHAMLLAMGLASIIMVAVLLSEMMTLGVVGDRLMGPYGDLVPGGFLGKAMMPLAMVLAVLATTAPTRVALPAFIGTSLLVVFTLFTGERVNTALIGAAVCLATLSQGVRPMRLYIMGGSGFALILSLMGLFPGIRDKIMVWNKPEVSHYFQSDYWFSLRPGIVGFLENPLSGLGVGMHRLVCPEIGNGPDWLPGQNSCHPHAHQFYVQIAEETGIFGLGLAIIMVVQIFLSALRHAKQRKSFTRIAWIVPLMMFFPQPSADFFGQWNNLFLWFALGLAMAMAQLHDPHKKTGKN